MLDCEILNMVRLLNCCTTELQKTNLQRSQRCSSILRSGLSRCPQEAHLHLQCQRWGQTDNPSQLLTFTFVNSCFFFVFFLNLVTPIGGQWVACRAYWSGIWKKKAVSWVAIRGRSALLLPLPPSAVCWFTSPSRQSASENEVILQPPARRKCSQSAWVLTQNLILIKWLMSHGINANDFLKQTSINH